MSPRVLLALVLVGASGCSLFKTDPSFSPDELPDLAPRQSEVPTPLAVHEDHSGYLSPGVAEGDPPPDQPVRLDLEFEVYAYRALFTQPELVDVFRIPDDTPQIVWHASWYTGSDAASRGFEEHMGPLHPPGFAGDPIAVSWLGSEAGRFEEPPNDEYPLRGDYIVWRRDNVVFSLLSQGIPFEQVMSAAYRVDQRVATQD